MVETQDVVVIGGGITGLTGAFEILKALPDAKVRVIEASDRLGGIVGTQVHDGWTVDIGPHGFIDNGSDTKSLVNDLGIAEDLVSAEREAATISLMRDGSLTEVPGSLAGTVKTGLISWRAKLRLLAEPFVRRVEAEDSVVDFVTRRFGREVAQTFAVPAVRGVVGGDANSFGIEGEFPVIKDLERQYGSVLIGALRMQARRHREDPLATRLPSFREFADRLKSFHGNGMERLIHALGASLGDRVALNTPATALERDGEHWVVVTSTGERIRTAHVLVALGAQLAADLIADHHADMAAELNSLPRPDIRVLALGYRADQVQRRPRGIGLIATPGLPSDVLGAIHASAIFPEQCPPGMILIRVLAGGTSDSRILSLPEQDAIDLVHQDLTPVFGLAAPPVFTRTALWEGSIPTYPVGHRPRIRALLSSVDSMGGLHLAGNAYFGVGVNDCVRDARRAVDSLLAQVDRAASPALAG